MPHRTFASKPSRPTPTNVALKTACFCINFDLNLTNVVGSRNQNCVQASEAITFCDFFLCTVIYIAYFNGFSLK